MSTANTLVGCRTATGPFGKIGRSRPWSMGSPGGGQLPVLSRVGSWDGLSVDAKHAWPMQALSEQDGLLILEPCCPPIETACLCDGVKPHHWVPLEHYHGENMSCFALFDIQDNGIVQYERNAMKFQLEYKRAIDSPSHWQPVCGRGMQGRNASLAGAGGRLSCSSQLGLKATAGRSPRAPTTVVCSCNGSCRQGNGGTPSHISTRVPDNPGLCEVQTESFVQSDMTWRSAPRLSYRPPDGKPPTERAAGVGDARLHRAH